MSLSNVAPSWRIFCWWKLERQRLLSHGYLIGDILWDIGLAILALSRCFCCRSPPRHVLYPLEQYYAELCADLDDVWSDVPTHYPCSTGFSFWHVQPCPVMVANTSPNYCNTSSLTIRLHKEVIAKPLHCLSRRRHIRTVCLIFHGITAQVSCYKVW